MSSQRIGNPSDFRVGQWCFMCCEHDLEQLTTKEQVEEVATYNREYEKWAVAYNVYPTYESAMEEAS